MRRTATFLSSARAWTLALAGVVGASLLACTPDEAVFGGTITGTVLDYSAQPVGLVTVYVVDESDGEKTEQTDALSGANGRFRLVVPAGRWTVVATDFMGAAAFVYDVHVGNGAVYDVGPVYLQPCAEPGSGSNGQYYEECPDPDTDANVGYGAPSGPVSLGTFTPAFTDASISVDPVGLDLVTVSSYDDASGWRLDLQFTEDYFGEGSYAIDESDAASFFATLYDQNASVIYLLGSGTFVLEELVEEEGGTFRARLTDTTFHWYDYESGFVDPSFTAHIAETSPAMNDSLSMSEVTPGGGGGPPPESNYALGVVQPEFTQVYVAGDGSVEVATYDVFDTGEFVQIFLDIPAALNTSGQHFVQNTFGTSQSSWAIQLAAHASYTDEFGYEYLFVLESATLHVTDPAAGPNDSFAASLEDATFYWQDHPASPPYSTITLTMESSGSMQGVADPAAPDDGGYGRVDWLQVKDELLVQLGN